MCLQDNCYQKEDGPQQNLNEISSNIHPAWVTTALNLESLQISET